MPLPRKPEPPPKTCLACGQVYRARQILKPNGSFNGWHSPPKYCSFECYADFRAKTARGFIKYPGEPGFGYRIIRGKREHREVMEKVLGRKLKKGETVHHKDGNRINNSPENLELWAHNHPPGQRITDKDIWSGMIPPYQHGAL